MQSIIEMPAFMKCAKKLGLSVEEIHDIVDIIAKEPSKGDEIAGTGGVRKVRIAGRGKGKSGGYRVITFFTGADIPVFLLYMYGKDEKDNLTGAEKNAYKTVTKSIVETYRSKRK